MIIQCEKCATKYRFDDNLMEGEGIWVRCSRCKYEFFQENPFARPFPAVDDDTVLKHLDDLRSGIREQEPTELPFSVLPESEVEQSAPESSEPGERDVKPVQKKGGIARFLKAFCKGILVFILLLLFVIVCLWSYMQLGGLKLKDIAPVVPYLNQLWPVETPAMVKLSQIKIANLRQRYVQHWILGNLLVVEGTVWNSAPFPVARIRVQARLLDHKGVLLAREEAFAGNLLTDMELTTFPDENIKRELALSQGSEASNDRVESRSQIPFMIVFTRDYPMAVKTMVHVSGVEKLLTP